MTLGQIAEYRKILELGRVADDKLSEERVYLRGFNDDVKFAQKHFDQIEKGKAHE